MYVWPAGEARAVPDDVARIVTAGHPDKLVYEIEAVAAEDVPAHRMLDTTAATHRHRWRADRTCRCGVAQDDDAEA